MNCMYADECLYNTEQQLFKRLKRFCQYPELARKSGAKLKDQVCFKQGQYYSVLHGYALDIRARFVG